MIVMSTLHFPPIDLTCSLEHERAKQRPGPTTSADKYTGAIILRTRPHTYKRVVRLLSEGVPAIRIARDCKVTERSVAAIAKREREEITERKKSLAGLMSNIAEIGGANVERKIGKASVRDAIIGTGVAIDKMLALTGQTPAVQIANIVLPSEEERAERRALHDKLDEIAARLRTAAYSRGRGITRRARLELRERVCREKGRCTPLNVGIAKP